MLHDGEMHVVSQLLKCACVCIVSLQMAEATLKALANDGDSITVGRISITAKKTSTGQTYLMVSQPVKDKKDRRCCWFPNDWMAIRAAIPQVQTLLKSSKKEHVEVNVSAKRTVKFTVDNDTVLISLEMRKGDAATTCFSTWMLASDWQCLVCKQKVLDNYLEPEGTAPEVKSSRGIKRKRDATLSDQIPIWGRKYSITYFKYILYSSDDSILANSNMFKIKESGSYFSRDKCSEEGERMKRVFGKEAGRLDIVSHKYFVTNEMRMVKLLYIWLVSKKISDKKVDHDNSGCIKVDLSPGHQCPQDWEEFAADNCEELAADILPADIADVYIEMLKLLDVPIPRTICAISQCAKEYITDLCDDVQFYCESGNWFLPFQDQLFEECLSIVEANKENNKEAETK